MVTNVKGVGPCFSSDVAFHPPAVKLHYFQGRLSIFNINTSLSGSEMSLSLGEFNDINNGLKSCLRPSFRAQLGTPFDMAKNLQVFRVETGVIDFSVPDPEEHKSLL